jgi:PIN domain nuclease of toxin-antitoxin system
MRIIIDTHIFIWYIQNSDRLPRSVALQIDDGRNDILLSIASVWEMAIKQSTGKLNLGVAYAGFIREQLKINNMALLPASLEHLELVTTLPFHHRDPFD